MGSVSVDITKQEREYENLTLSDINVIKYLILYRNKIDKGYSATVDRNIYTAGDTFEFNVEIICLYVDLDKLIEDAELTKSQMSFVKMLFDGNTTRDVAEIMNIDYRTTDRMLDRIVDKIKHANDERWYFVIQHNIFKMNKDVKNIDKIKNNPKTP